jgi:hypothetical protein
MNISVLWNTMASSPLKINRSVGEECRPSLQSKGVLQARSQHEAGRIIASRWFLSWLIFRPWRWRQHVPPKHRFTLNGLGSVRCHKTELLNDHILNSINWLVFIMQMKCVSCEVRTVYLNIISWTSASIIPCGGGVEYLHRIAASRRRRRKGNPVSGGMTGPPCFWRIWIRGPGPPGWGSLESETVKCGGTQT